jgi:hypothetical protein
MHVSEWSKSEVEYGRRVLNSGLEGARSGREAFLNGRPFTPFFRESFQKALKSAAVGACVGMLTSCPRNGHRSVGRALTSSLFGGLMGLAAGMIWEARFLAASAAGGVAERVGRVRDEHWLEKNPIDYA